jgi:hypothetical protein
MLHPALDERSLLAVVSLRGCKNPWEATLVEAVSSLAIDPLEAKYLEEIPSGVTMGHLAADFGSKMRSICVEIASAYLAGRSGLPFVMADLKTTSPFLFQWVYAELVVVAAESAFLGSDPRIVERVALMRSWSEMGYQPTRKERHRVAMWDRSSRLAGMILPSVLRGAAQGDPFSLTQVQASWIADIRPRLAYACMGFRGPV